MNNKNTQYLCLDKEGKTLFFNQESGIILSWDKKAEYDWICPIDKKSINEYYNGAKSLTATDLLYYYADELIEEWSEKTKVLDNILELEKQFKEFDKGNFYYPITSNHQLDKKSIMPGGGVDPRDFILNNAAQLYTALELESRKKSYAKMCAIFDNINILWQKIDNTLKNYGVKPMTAMAGQYDGGGMVGAIYYHQLKEILPPQVGVINHGEKTMKKIRSHDYKIKDGQWDAEDTVFADIEISKQRNIKYLTGFELLEIHGSWLVEVSLIEPAIEQRGQYYPDDNEFGDIAKMEMSIEKTGIFLGKTIKDFADRGHGEAMILAQLKNGKIEALVLSRESKKLKSYCEDINISLEKARLEEELSKLNVEVSRERYVSKI